MTTEATEAGADLAPEAKIVSPKARSVTVQLDWPVEYDGKTYDSVTVRRVTGLDIEKFIEAAADRDADAPNLAPPMLDCPQAVYEAMDDDDRLRLEEALLPFLPRRLQQVVGLTPKTGADITA